MKLIEKIVFSSSVIFGLFLIGPEVKSPDLDKALPIINVKIGLKIGKLL